MASIGHLAVGALAGRLYRTDSPREAWVAMGAFSALAMLPDIDVTWVALGVADRGLAGHRGFTHTWLFALVIAGLSALWARYAKRAVLETALFTLLAVASHGVLDSMTFHSRGTMLFWPFVPDRVVIPWRPLPSAPTGLGFFGLRGLEITIVETLFFLPVFLLAAWKRLAEGARFFHPLRRAMLIAGAVTVSLLLSEVTFRNFDVVSRLEAPSQKELASRDRHRLLR